SNSFIRSPQSMCASRKSQTAQANSPGQTSLAGAILDANCETCRQLEPRLRRFKRHGCRLWLLVLQRRLISALRIRRTALTEWMPGVVGIHRSGGSGLAAISTARQFVGDHFFVDYLQ